MIGGSLIVGGVAVSIPSVRGTQGGSTRNGIEKVVKCGDLDTKWWKTTFEKKCLIK